MSTKLSAGERLLLSNLAVLGVMGTRPVSRIVAYKTVERSNYGAKGKKNSRKNRKGKK